jgi:ComF family protein
MSALFSDRWSSILGRLVPAACVLCGDRANPSGVCDGCLDALPRLAEARCPTCAAATATAETCGRCLSHPPRYDRVLVALEYAHPVDALVGALKYGRALPAARPLAFCLAQALDRAPYPDIVIAMPMSAARLAERGFNQAGEIARLVCAEFGLAVAPALATRTRGSVPQAALPWRLRKKNVRGAFECAADLGGQRVAVVDDVLTTGATLDELAGVLKRQGARSVTGWVAARTLAGR